ncbi:G-type lectin S-receptor-like serine/threonine-protein kinase At1g11410 isoform X1 [Vitis riparia]|uniref:G-type lectin S-receptor-like serine/threonine-protein kinase At1g11410 isoform X1 n=1 Tax=Vitis riparia TaxID=96939 RepID=UPI00155B1A19|nr:G-type lectin S-receptor-like serine/threonine-protein kinase At1g11410 isoform X1 [Vitis riparia]
MFFHYLLLFLALPYCSSADTITPNQAIRDGDVLVSHAASFALGFFSPGNSTLRYVGLWFNNVSEKTVVWVLNRDLPINDTSGVLSVSSTGNLVLYHRHTPIWSTNISILSVNATVAQLLDTGNLVLFERESRRVLWQGFDYPTDTMLPNMKLGVDRRTGLNRFLSSWKSPEDPGTGDYSFKIDVNGSPQFFLCKGTDRLWRTGPWNGLRWSGVPEMINTFIFHINFLNTPDEASVIYTLHNSSFFSRLMVDGSGHVQRKTWHESGHQWMGFWSAPKDDCDNYGRCGPYGSCNANSAPNFECTCLPGFQPKSPSDWYLRDGSAGCVRKAGAKLCGSGEGFVKVRSVKIPDTSEARVDMSMGMEACREECLRNCNCSGYTSANVSGGESGCVSWDGVLMDTRDYTEGGQDLFVRVDAAVLAENTERPKGILQKKWLLAILVIPGAVLLFLIISLACRFIRKKRKDKARQRGLEISFISSSSLFQRSPAAKEHDESRRNSELQFFDLGTIAAATRNFSFANKLGQGGFGPVYKGQLPSGQEIAVKRLSSTSRQGIEEFKNEVSLIAKLQHRNLVRLLGCCIEGDETKRSLLDWKKRFEIILGIARGILYLHQDSRLRIIHRDLKASNVLLDAKMNPKISDFGMARIFGGDQIEGNTSRVVGTYGYMSPEYAMEGLFSIKSDVYSFGILLLEIISGRKNSAYYEDNSSQNLVGHVWKLWREDRALDVIDPSMEKTYPADEVLRCIQIGLLCVQECATDRPTMLTIIFMLGNNSTLPSPQQPAFVIKTTSSQGVSSVNEVTVSMVEAR